MENKKPYCVQNDGDCSTCSLSSYGRDCMNNPIKSKEEMQNENKNN